jgi:hypothetical protein
MWSSTLVQGEEARPFWIFGAAGPHGEGRVASSRSRFSSGTHVDPGRYNGLHALPGEDVVSEDDQFVTAIGIQQEQLDWVAEVEVPNLVGR